MLKIPKIVAEAATNHNGDIIIAKEMINAAKDAGADVIKFQSWQTRNMDPGNPAYKIMKTKELSDDDHYLLLDECNKTGIEFLTTCFDVKRVEFLASLGLKTIKVASTDVGSLRLLRMLRERFENIILSTGMSYSSEIEKAVKVLHSGNFTLLHCVSLYPTPPGKANLKRILTLQQFAENVGYSDHTIGNTASKIAIAMGATIIEKHFTLKRNPDNVFSNISCLPSDIKKICDFARDYELMKGSGSPDLFKEENDSRRLFIGRWGDNV